MSLPNFSRPSPTNGYYDVFLSFRGKDTRKGFATTLCRYLRKKKIHTFMDDRLLGHEINKLFEMIKKSRMAVVIYSESYASSDWCLQELVKILKRRKKEKQLLLPIFLEVNPSELINLTGKTQEYLDKHSLIEHGRRTIESWKDALREFGEVSGRLCFTDDDYRSEFEFIQKIEVAINKMLRECEQTRQYSVKSSAGAADLMKLQPSDQDFSRPSRNGYDVFLSFRGEDTRKGFTTNLCQFLRGKNIHTFMDDRPRGQEIDNLFVMIKKSRMAIVIYSERYASSDWCLQELVKILKRWKKEKQLMLPIFLKVNPSELKQLTGKTQEYLDTHNISEHGNRTIQSWKDAVRKIGEVSGLSYTDYDRWSEYEFIEKCVVERINEILAADSEEETEEEGSIKSSMDATAADQAFAKRAKGKKKEPSPRDAALLIQMCFKAYLVRRSRALRAANNKGKKKESSPHDAALLIQMCFRAHLLRRSRAFRALRELAVAKPKIKEISALFNNFSYRRRIACDAEERQRFSERIIVLLLTVDATEGADMMIRASKKSMVDQLEAMLDVDPAAGHRYRPRRGGRLM